MTSDSLSTMRAAVARLRDNGPGDDAIEELSRAVLELAERMEALERRVAPLHEKAAVYGGSRRPAGVR